MNDPCQPFRDRLWAVLDATEEPTAAPSLVDHLRSCAACRVEFTRAVRAERLLFSAAVVSEGEVASTANADSRRSSSVGIRRRPTTAVVRRTTKRIRRRPVLSFAPWLAGAAALVLLAIGIALTAGPRASSTPWAVVEEARALTGADGRVLVRDAALAVGARLSAEGQSVVRLRDGTRLWLEAGTRLGLDEGGTLRTGGRAGIQVQLDSGAVGVTAKPQDPRAPLVVSTPLTEVVVVGTAFRVAHAVTGSEVSVTSGTVELRSAQGTRLLAAGGLARIAAAPVAPSLIASFSAVSVARAAPIDGALAGWPGSGALLALPPAGAERPFLRQLGQGNGLCFNGRTQRLETALSALDARQGLTLVALFIPIHAGRDQRVVAVTDGSRERFALVRHDLEPGAIAVAVDGSERVRLDVPKGKHWAVAARWRSDGSVTLNSGAGAGRTTIAGVTPGRLDIVKLMFAGSLTGRLLDGDLIAIELHHGVLDDAALSERVRSLAAANHHPLTAW